MEVSVKATSKPWINHRAKERCAELPIENSVKRLVPVSQQALVASRIAVSMLTSEEVAQWVRETLDVMADCFKQFARRLATPKHRRDHLDDAGWASAVAFP
jgi:hypothetical protein